MQSVILFALVAMATVYTSSSFKLYDFRSQPYPMFRSSRAELRGAPKRPQNFQNVAELNRYLSDITDYYTVLGRPRFGKRSLDTDKPEWPLSFSSSSQLERAIEGAKQEKTR